ncbi:MAG: hypothetical protein Q9167_003537 [Letrouitia subvulpina]
MKRKAPRSWAEDILELDDIALKDLDPEGPNDEDSSVATSDGESAQAREHYVEVGKSKLRKPTETTLGLEYSGSRISRDDLMADSEDSFEDPFAAPEGERSGSEEIDIGTEVVDSKVGLLRNADKNEEIGKDKALGENNQEVLHGFVSKGNKKSSWNSLGKENHRSLGNKEGDDESFRSFESLESERKDQYQANGTSEVSENEEFDVLKGKDIDRKMEWLPSDQKRIANSPPEDSSQEKSDSGDEEDGGTGLESDTSMSSDEEVSDASSAFDTDTDTESTSPPMTDERATLRKMMAESQRSIAENLSKAAKSDIAKGRAIKQQRTTFDTLLSTRLRLQKALIAANTLPTASRDDTRDEEAVRAAENAALNLWSTIDSLRSSLYTGSEPQTFEPDASTSLLSLWTRMRSHETHFHAHRRTVLDKWSLKTAPPSSLSRSKLLPQSTQLPLSSVLDQQLSGSNMQKLLSRSRTPRSCAPVQASAAVAGKNNATAAAIEDPTIYDDADFYAQLLRELVDQRMATANQSDGLVAPISNGVNGIPGIKDRSLRIKKNVDTKASKGRKIRYTVHEKLQNFMAPEDRGSWGERQRDELFRGLLGRRVAVDEGGDEDDGIDKAEEGLRLFRS